MFVDEAFSFGDIHRLHEMLDLQIATDALAKARQDKLDKTK